MVEAENRGWIWGGEVLGTAVPVDRSGDAFASTKWSWRRRFLLSSANKELINKCDHFSTWQLAMATVKPRQLRLRLRDC